MLFNEQINMSEVVVGGGVGGAPQPATAAPVPRTAPAATAPATQHKPDRFPASGGGTPAPSSTDGGKHSHKTYVRGRGAHRGNNNRR